MDYSLIIFVNGFLIIKFFLILQKQYKGLPRRTEGVTERIQARTGCERGPQMCGHSRKVSVNLYRSILFSTRDLIYLLD